MAQPFKQGLDYFNVDVDLDEDEKIIALDKKFPETYKFIFFIWKFVYKHSYYVHWTELEIGKFETKSKFSREYLDEMVSYCLEIKFFDKKLYEKYGILTSQSIQTRWLSNSKRRKHISLQYNFILIEPDILKKLSVAALSITKIIDPKFKSPNKNISSSPKPPNVIPAPKAQHVPQVDAVSKKMYGTHTHEEVLNFIKIPYADRSAEFKELHNKSWYESYIKFNKLIDSEFVSLRISLFQITLPQYKVIMTDHRAILTQKKVSEVLSKMSSSGTSPSSQMSMRFIQFLIPQNNNNQNGQPKQELPAHVNFTKPRAKQ